MIFARTTHLCWIALFCLTAIAGCDRVDDDGEIRAETASERTRERIEAARRAEQGDEGAEQGQQRAAQARAEPPQAGQAAPSPGSRAAPDPALLDPSAADEQAPDEYTAVLETTEGPIRIDVHRDWAPKGADRFYNLVKLGFFEDVAFFRVIDGFMAQAGLHGNPAVNGAWRGASIEDDEPKQSNTRGMVSFAMAGPNSRTTQFFVNTVDNSRLDPMGFAPFGKVREGDMETVDALYSGYGEGAPRGRGPSQGRIQMQGNEYLRAEFPELDYIESARIED